MGISAGSAGHYEDNTISGAAESGQPSKAEGAGENVVPSSETRVYSEEGTVAPDPTAMTGTLDTSGIGPGPHEDLRNITDTFNASDARVATALEEGEGEYARAAGDEEQQQKTAEVLRERSGTEPGQGPQEVAGGGAPANSETETTRETETSRETETTANPDRTTEPVGAETEKDAEKDGKFDPDSHSVKEIKTHLDKSDEAEVQRVIEVERKGQNRPGVVNYKK